MMDPAQWAKLSPLLDELLELEGERRRKRLQELDATEPESAQALRKLIDNDDTRPDFLSEPVFRTATLMPRAGQELGPYRLMELLGEGGMGQVWLAVRSDGLFERRVALKLLRAGFADAGLHQRFARERQILARLAHPHIARLLDAGTASNGQPYLALEYVRGEPITTFATQHGLDLRHRIELFLQVCAAVSHAHANLVVHRDLKPSNILVTALGDVCLLDFGIAKLLDRDQRETQEITRAGSRALTLHYAAPEQLRGEDVTTMTDVFALGMVLFELLSGRRAFEPKRDSDAAWEECVLNDEPLLASQAASLQERVGNVSYQARLARALRGDVDVILAKTLRRHPSERYVSVEALARDLRRYLEGQPILARPHSFTYRSGKFLRRHAWSIAGAVIVTTLMGTGLWFTSVQAHRAGMQAERAQALQSFVVGLFDATETRDGSVQGRDLLDQGERRAEQELSDQPQAQAELLGLIAKLRGRLGDDEAVLRVLSKQDEALARVPSAPPDIALQAASARAEAWMHLRQPAQCVEKLRPMQVMADQADAGYAAARAGFYSALARCLIEMSRHEEARGLLDQASKLREEADDPAAFAMLQADYAHLHLSEGRHREALNAIQDALSTLRRATGERSRQGAEIWQVTAQVYTRLGDDNEAAAAYRQALDIGQERLANGHPLIQQLIYSLAETYGRLHEYREADQEFERWMKAGGSGRNDDTASHRAWLSRAEAAWHLRRYDQARNWYRQTADVLERDPRDPMYAQAVCGWARVALGLRDFATANAQAERCEALATGAMKAEAQLLRADIENAQGQVTQAVQRWQGLINSAVWPQAELELLAVEDVADLSDFTLRADALRRRLLRATGSEPAQWQLQALIAGHECRSGGAEVGQARLRAALSEAERKRRDDLVLHERIARHAGACRGG